MARSRWQTVSQIFEVAVDLPPEERVRFVREACGGDPAMEFEVARLLAADERAGSFLEGPAVSTLSPVTRAARSDTPSPLLAVGAVAAGRFQVLRFIGQGGMGQVYEALDLELKSHIALKLIRPDIASDPRMLSRFRREVQLTRMITHPNVCRTFDIERHQSPASGEPSNQASHDLVFLTMELLEGETLAALLRREGRLTPTQALPLALQMIDALAAAHSVAVIHRDFKPSNVLLVRAATAKASPIPSGEWTSSGSRPDGSKTDIRELRVVVTDFGLARAVAADERDTGSAAESLTTTLTGDQTLMGTLAYMAPEQFERGEASAASDIYSLGLVMFEMITGQRPFADDLSFAEATKRLKQAPPLTSSIAAGIASAWDHTIARCLALEPKDRFKSVQEVSKALVDPAVAVAGDQRLAFRPATSIAETNPAAYIDVITTPRVRRRRILVVATIFAVVLSPSVVLLRNYWVKAEEAKLGEGSTVLLTNIQNGTEDKRFDDTTELVRRQLLQSPYFSLMDSDRIQKTLASMLKPAHAALDPQTAREVAMRNGVRRVVFGTVTRVGDSYVLDLDIEQPDNSPLRFRRHWENHWTWNNSSHSTSKDMPSGFLDAVRDSSDWIRHQIGESPNDIAHEDTPPEDVTTSNWEALSDFTQAEQFRVARNNEAAIVALRNSVAADQNFALGYARLGDVLVSLSRFTEGYRAYDRALTLGQQRLTRRERDRISGIYASDTWDYKRAEEIFHDYTTYYPHDYLGWFYRALPLMMLGRTEEAIQSLKKAVDADSGEMFAPAHIARFDLIIGNFDDAENWTRRLREFGYIDSAELHDGQRCFLQGHYQESRDHFTKLKLSSDPLYRSYGYALLARLYAEQTKYEDSLKEIEQGIAVDREAGDNAHEADKLLDRAYIYCKLGQYDGCIRDTKSALDFDRSLPRSLSGATLLGQAAYQANTSTKARIAKELRSLEARIPSVKVSPLSDIVRAHIHGEVLLAENRWLASLREFEKADRLEPPTSDKEYLGRALALTAEHSPEMTAVHLRQQAREAFTKLSKKPGLVWEWSLNYFPGYLTSQSHGLDTMHSHIQKGETK